MRFIYSLPVSGCVFLQKRKTTTNPNKGVKNLQATPTAYPWPPQSEIDPSTRPMKLLLSNEKLCKLLKIQPTKTLNCLVVFWFLIQWNLLPFYFGFFFLPPSQLCFFWGVLHSFIFICKKEKQFQKIWKKNKTKKKKQNQNQNFFMFLKTSKLISTIVFPLTGSSLLKWV